MSISNNRNLRRLEEKKEIIFIGVFTPISVDGEKECSLSYEIVETEINQVQIHELLRESNNTRTYRIIVLMYVIV